MSSLFHEKFTLPDFGRVRGLPYLRRYAPTCDRSLENGNLVYV